MEKARHTFQTIYPKQKNKDDSPAGSDKHSFSQSHEDTTHAGKDPDFSENEEKTPFSTTVTVDEEQSPSRLSIDQPESSHPSSSWNTVKALSGKMVTKLTENDLVKKHWKTAATVTALACVIILTYWKFANNTASNPNETSSLIDFQELIPPALVDQSRAVYIPPIPEVPSTLVVASSPEECPIIYEDSVPHTYADLTDLNTSGNTISFAPFIIIATVVGAVATNCISRAARSFTGMATPFITGKNHEEPKPLKEPSFIPEKNDEKPNEKLDEKIKKLSNSETEVGLSPTTQLAIIYSQLEGLKKQLEDQLETLPEVEEVAEEIKNIEEEIEMQIAAIFPKEGITVDLYAATKKIKEVQRRIKTEPLTTEGKVLLIISLNILIWKILKETFNKELESINTLPENYFELTLFEKGLENYEKSNLGDDKKRQNHLMELVTGLNKIIETVKDYHSLSTTNIDSIIKAESEEAIESLKKTAQSLKNIIHNIVGTESLQEKWIKEILFRNAKIGELLPKNSAYPLDKKTLAKDSLNDLISLEELLKTTYQRLRDLSIVQYGLKGATKKSLQAVINILQRAYPSEINSLNSDIPPFYREVFLNQVEEVVGQISLSILRKLNVFPQELDIYFNKPPSMPSIDEHFGWLKKVILTQAALIEGGKETPQEIKEGRDNAIREISEFLYDPFNLLTPEEWEEANEIIEKISLSSDINVIEKESERLIIELNKKWAKRDTRVKDHTAQMNEHVNLIILERSQTNGGLSQRDQGLLDLMASTNEILNKSEEKNYPLNPNAIRTLQRNSVQLANETLTLDLKIENMNISQLICRLKQLNNELNINPNSPSYYSMKEVRSEVTRITERAIALQPSNSTLPSIQKILEQGFNNVPDRLRSQIYRLSDQITSLENNLLKGVSFKPAFNTQEMLSNYRTLAKAIEGDKVAFTATGEMYISSETTQIYSGKAWQGSSRMMARSIWGNETDGEKVADKTLTMNQIVSNYLDSLSLESVNEEELMDIASTLDTFNQTLASALPGVKNLIATYEGEDKNDVAAAWEKVGGDIEIMQNRIDEFQSHLAGLGITAKVEAIIVEEEASYLETITDVTSRVGRMIQPWIEPGINKVSSAIDSYFINTPPWKEKKGEVILAQMQQAFEMLLNKPDDDPDRIILSEDAFKIIYQTQRGLYRDLNSCINIQDVVDVLEGTQPCEPLNLEVAQLLKLLIADTASNHKNAFDFMTKLREVYESKEFKVALDASDEEASLAVDLILSLCYCRIHEIQMYDFCEDVIGTVIEDGHPGLWDTEKRLTEASFTAIENASYKFKTAQAGTQAGTQAGKAGGEVGCGFDPHIGDNTPFVLGDVNLIPLNTAEAKTVRLLRMASPTKEDCYRNIEIIPEFRGYLEYLKRKGKSHLYVSLQNDQSSILQHEKERNAALKELQNDFPGTFHFVVLAQDSDFYKQKIHNPYTASQEFELFKEHFMREMLSEGTGFYFPPEWKNDPAFKKGIKDLLTLVHESMYGRKTYLKIKENVDFIENYYAFLEIFLMRYSGVDVALIACKNAIDRAGKNNALLLWLLIMLDENENNPDIQRIHEVLGHSGAFLAKTEAIVPRRRKRFMSAFARTNADFIAEKIRMQGSELLGKPADGQGMLRVLRGQQGQKMGEINMRSFLSKMEKSLPPPVFDALDDEIKSAMDNLIEADEENRMFLHDLSSKILNDQDIQYALNHLKFEKNDVSTKTEKKIMSHLLVFACIGIDTPVPVIDKKDLLYGLNRPLETVQIQEDSIPSTQQLSEINGYPIMVFLEKFKDFSETQKNAHS